MKITISKVTKAMMIYSKDCSGFHVPLFLMAFLTGHISFAKPSQDPASNPIQPIGDANEILELPSNDYYDDYNVTSSTTPLLKTFDNKHLNECDFDVCVEKQIPCWKLKESNDCRCPGMTSDRVPPDPPSLVKLSRSGSKVLVVWCAPLSFVTSYKVTIGGKDEANFGESQRSGTIGNLSRKAEVCVIAENNAGASKGACMIYQPERNGISLRAGLIGGALGFLLLFSLAILLWRHRKKEARISTQGTTATALDNREWTQTS